MARLKLTDKRVEKLTTKRPQEDFWDELTPGLCLRVSGKTGRKTWLVRYRSNGTHRRMKIGVFTRLGLAKAREAARDVLAAADAGKDPLQERVEAQEAAEVAAGGSTFAHHAKSVLDRRAAQEGLRPSTVAERNRVLDKILIPAWGDREVASIRRGDVKALRDALADTPVQANRVVSIVSLIFNELLDDELVDANPAHRVRRLPEDKRSRWLSLAEIKGAWDLFTSMGMVTGGALKLTLLTAQRIGSVRSMEWDEIHGETWRIPATKFKGGRDHWVPLSSEARALLASLEGLDEQWVFPALRSDSETGHVGQTNSALYTAVRKTKIKPFRAHDLRETFRTWSTRPTNSSDRDIPPGCGVAPEAADAVLGHADLTVALKHYHGRPEEHRLGEKRDALEKWGLLVRKAVEAKGQAPGSGGGEDGR